MPTLVLIRHGQSSWNLENRFTGWWDVNLTELGIEEARAAGTLLAEKGLELRTDWQEGLPTFRTDPAQVQGVIAVGGSTAPAALADLVDGVVESGVQVFDEDLVTWGSDADLAWLFHMNRGVFMTPGQDEEWTLSVMHTDADLQRYIDAFETGSPVSSEIAVWYSNITCSPPWEISGW